MKIALANLPWKVHDRWGVRAGSRWPHIKTSQEGDYTPFPFFLAYAAALLKKNGYEVYLIDAIAEKLSYENFIRKVKNISPAFIVAETSTASLYNDLVLLKRLRKSMKLILCGPDINIAQEEFLDKHPYIDYVLKGEYEITLLELIGHLDKDKIPEAVKGIIYREKNRIIKNPERPLLDNLDILPWPMRESLPMERYYDVPGGLPVPSVQMLASRGCPFSCVFCAWPQIMYKKGSYRTRSVKDIIAEMRYLVDYYGFKSVYFDDDTWNVGKDRVLNFCGEITELNKEDGKGVPWAMMARADLMDEEQLAALKKAGLHAVKYGVESSDQDILDNAKKSMNLKNAERMIRLTMAMGIKTHLTFTFGLPGETRETIEKTIDYALRLNPSSAQFSITTPYPGTDYFLELDKKGDLLTKEWSEYDGNYKSVFRSDSLTAEELVEAKERACSAWESHCRHREPNYDFPVQKLINKFWKYINTKGVLYSFYKTYDYLKFVIKRSDLYQRWSMHSIKKGKLKILYGLGKVKIFWNDAELTKGVGLNTSLSIYENWFDSSQADWKVLEKTASSVILTNEWKYLPLKQIWRIDISGDNAVDWNITNIYKEDIELNNEKTGIMLSEKYNGWIAGGKEGEFKISRNWQEINFKEASKKEVGAKDLKNPNFPVIMLDFSSDGVEAFPQIQSSSRDLNARFIHANFFRKVSYAAGEYDFFKGKIYILEAGEQKKFQPEKNISGNRRSLLKLFLNYVKNRNLPYALKKTFKYLDPKNIRKEYLEIIGVFDGEYAYTGPSFIQMDITNDCNNDCIGCWCNSPLLKEKRIPPEIKSQVLSFEAIKSFLDEAAGMGAKEIYYAGGGEPFMHPRIMDVLAYTKKKGLICYVNTNFTLIDKDKAKQLVDLGLDHLTVSIWAGSPGIYAATHPNKDEKTFCRIKENLSYLNSLKDGVKKPYIKVYHVISNINYHEILEMVDFALNTDSESMEFTVIDTMPGATDCLLLNKEQTDEVTAKCETLKSRIDKGEYKGRLEILDFERFYRRISNVSAGEGQYDKGLLNELPCYVGWTFARILADGNVNSCLKSHRFPVGNIYTESFSDIWNRERQRQFRRNALKPKEGNPFFSIIGNDPALKVGCYKSCDDMGRNLYMRSKILSLGEAKKFLLKNLAGYFRARKLYTAGKG